MADDTQSGIGITEDNDWSIDSTGDTAIFTGQMEVEKDLCLLLQHYLSKSGILGEPLDEGTESKIRIRTRNIIESDERVDEVTNMRIIDSRDADTAEVEVAIQLVEGGTAIVSSEE